MLEKRTICKNRIYMSNTLKNVKKYFFDKIYIIKHNPVHHNFDLIAMKVQCSYKCMRFTTMELLMHQSKIFKIYILTVDLIVKLFSYLRGSKKSEKN